LDFQTDAKLFHSKSGLPRIKKIGIKYGFAWFEIRNSSPYRNFFRCKKDFEYKFKEDFRVWIWMGFDEILIGTSRFDGIWAKGSCLHLDDKSTHGIEVGISNFVSFLIYFKNLIWIDLSFDFGLLRIGLTNEFDPWLRP
jgi:hypothetical protein